MMMLLGLFLLAMMAAWLLWHYAPERKWALVRFLARLGAIALYVYAFILLVTMMGQEDDIRLRLSQEIVPAWAAAPMIWAIWGGWKWLHIDEWISGPRGR